ncbi:nuclear pore complex protein NUP107 isoform X1 [Beta vulgaris subsp. vulgaris]|uniref:nuclear pore complex protein NUP107 isoform X1 n=1 Tax=Beta vulgaris subsp. vulgaris TaxID=3555 RepID=UPI0005403235|nr:nuclear pore complex protein NUP107 isoform X1 [Beta vulgaris subsp. vulgaris]
MDVDMETSPSYVDPHDLSIREQYRRYGRRPSTSPLQDSSASRFGEGRMSNTALFLEDIKQEVESLDYREGTPSRPHSAYRRRSPDSQTITDFRSGADLSHQAGSHSLKACKIEEDVQDAGESTFSLFASLLDSANEGLLSIPDLILQFEKSCRDVSESIRYGSSERHRIVEDRLMRQKAQFLIDEAASWSLLWYLYGKGSEEIPEDLILSPTTSHLEACQFAVTDLTAQLCLRIVQWLEDLASKALELESKVRGSHVGTYLPSSGIWHNTQRYLKKNEKSLKTVKHLDFDAPTRENALPLPDDRKQDESLLEDVWTLVRAGRLEEACELCRSAGQPWRAASLCPFGGLDLVPSVEALSKNGKNRILQAIELESGIGRQWRLWKWACYSASERIAELGGGKYEAAVYAAQCSNLKRMLPICTDWESACWSMAKSWLDVQMDMELARLQPGRMELLKNYEETNGASPSQRVSSSGSSERPENWPLQVLNQQPRHLPSLIQKLHSSDMVHEAVTRGCKEQHRQIEMNLMSGDIPHLLDLVWSWISPSDDDQNAFRPHGDPHMIRFGAHLVLVLRFLLGDEVKDVFKEKIMNVGDLILHIYAMYLFSQQHEELVGIYASHLARHRCIDLFVHMMELRLNASVHIKYKLFLSSLEYLPFSPGDEPRGSFEEIIESVLSRSREIKVSKYENSADVAEQHRLQSLDKAMAIQWLCFTPPSTVDDVEAIGARLLLRAVMHSNILFREFALISMWRVPAMPIGSHKLLSFLAEPLKQPTENLLASEDHNVSDCLKEFRDWSEYYSSDATYRNWLKYELENAEVSPYELSVEEKQKVIAAAKEALSSSLLLLLRKENPWLVPGEDQIYDTTEPVFLELHATAILCLPSGECMCPDATLCATLMSALYSSVTEDVVLNRQLTVDVKVSPKNNFCVELILRCLAVEGDGLGPHELNDGGIIASVMAAGFKGELSRFQAGVTMEISRLDAWYSTGEGSLKDPAAYIVRGLCRRCCLPELILRCMQVSVSLVELFEVPEKHDELIELVACSETGLLHLFSQQQLQEFLLFEREYSICLMELQEEGSVSSHELY